jgi:hypothetical protein
MMVGRCPRPRLAALRGETTKALVWELSRRKVPSIIFDYQGEYASGDFFEAIQPQVFDVMKGLPINPFEIPIDPLTGRKRPYIEIVAEGHITPTAGTTITRSHHRATPSEVAQASPFQTLD